MRGVTRTGGWAAAAVLALAGTLAACSDDGADPEAFCARSLDTSEFAAIFDENFDPENVTEALAAFVEARDEEQALRDLAPEAVRSDIDVLIDYLDQLIEGLEAVDPDSTERPPVYDELRGRVDEVNAASGRIDQYVTATCTPTTT